MKLKAHNWTNLVCVIVCTVASIFCFITGNYFLGVLNMCSAILNLCVFLYAVSIWWKYSLKVADKYVFTCGKCGHQFIPSFWIWFFVPHFGSRRYMRCEKCKEIHWMRRK